MKSTQDDGFIDKVLVDEGALVRKGQLLFRPNSDEADLQVQQGAQATPRGEDQHYLGMTTDGGGLGFIFVPHDSNPLLRPFSNLGTITVHYRT